MPVTVNERTSEPFPGLTTSMLKSSRQVMRRFSPSKAIPSVAWHDDGFAAVIVRSSSPAAARAVGDAGSGLGRPAFGGLVGGWSVQARTPARRAATALRMSGKAFHGLDHDHGYGCCDGMTASSVEA